MVPKKAYNFIRNKREAGASEQDKVRVESLVRSLNQFDPQSKKIQNYNDELRLQL